MNVPQTHVSRMKAVGDTLHAKGYMEKYPQAMHMVMYDVSGVQMSKYSI
jgi:hypothetical protein